MWICPMPKEARDAIENLNDISLGKKPLVVKEAEEHSGPLRWRRIATGVQARPEAAEVATTEVNRATNNRGGNGGY